MMLCNRLIQYFLLIYFCFGHDLNHADPVAVKQAESSIAIDSLNKTTTIQKTENENIHIDETIPTSNDLDPTTDNESHPTETIQSSTTKYPQQVHIHPRHIPTEETTASTNVASKPNVSVEANRSMLISPGKNRQICWHLPKKFQPSIELLENQLFRLINILPEFLQSIFFGRIDDREVLMNIMWFGSICTMCCLFSFLFLSMGTKRLKQTKQEKEVRSRCQQLQQLNNQIQLECATFEQQNQKLSKQIDEIKSLPATDNDEDVFVLRTERTRFEEDLRMARTERDTLQQDVDRKQNLLLKYEDDAKGKVEIVKHLNDQILQLKQELENERATIRRIQLNDPSLENAEKSQQLIRELKSEITELKQGKFIDKDQLQELREHVRQVDIEKHQLTIRMKQLKDLLKQHSDENNHELLSLIDNDIEKSTQHIHELHSEIDEKTRRNKEMEISLKQEKDRCREMETKMKFFLELREHDARLHIRQLGQTDAELRKARTDTERVRILQQQLEHKQQQFDDVQKVLSNEQIKFNEEYGKCQHEVHEKWMEIKRLTRELDTSKKECEHLRKQITKYASLERTMIKPIQQHHEYAADSETNSSSPIPYQHGEFRPIDQQRNDSGAASPAEMFIPRPVPFGIPHPPFFPSPFMPPPNPFMMHPRFPMPPPGLHLTMNGSDANNSELVDSTNFTPNSTNYDAQSNGASSSPAVSDEKQLKPKKSKKSLKKKTSTSMIKEEV